FFFQAEDGIRDATVTGVQTCALPIFASRAGVDPYVAFGAAAAALFVLGLAVQRGLVDRVLDAPHEMQILLMLGVALILENTALRSEERRVGKGWSARLLVGRVGIENR